MKDNRSTYEFTVKVRAHNVEEAHAALRLGEFHQTQDVTLQHVTGPAVAKPKPVKPAYLEDPETIKALQPLRDFLEGKDQERIAIQAAFTASREAQA